MSYLAGSCKDGLNQRQRQPVDIGVGAQGGGEAVCTLVPRWLGTWASEFPLAGEGRPCLPWKPDHGRSLV